MVGGGGDGDAIFHKAHTHSQLHLSTCEIFRSLGLSAHLLAICTSHEHDDDDDGRVPVNNSRGRR